MEQYQDFEDAYVGALENVDRLTFKYLTEKKDCSNDFPSFEFEREVPCPGIVVYSRTVPNLGPAGEIRLSQINKGVTGISFGPPREPTEDEDTACGIVEKLADNPDALVYISMFLEHSCMFAIATELEKEFVDKLWELTDQLSGHLPKAVALLRKWRLRLFSVENTFYRDYLKERGIIPMEKQPSESNVADDTAKPELAKTIDILKQDAAKAQSEARGELPALFLSLGESERLRAIERVFARLHWRSEPKELDRDLNHAGYYVWIRSIGSKPYIWRYKYAFTIDIDVAGGIVLVAPPSAGYRNAEIIKQEFARLLEIECTLRETKRQNGNLKTGNTQKVDGQPKIKTRLRYAQRDKKICERWQNDGMTDDELAREFNMSPENVKKIRYKHGYKDHEKKRDKKAT